MTTQENKDKIMARDGWVRPAAFVAITKVVALATLHRRVANGDLPSTKPGGELYVAAAALHTSFLDETTGSATPLSEKVREGLQQLGVKGFEPTEEE